MGQYVVICTLMDESDADAYAGSDQKPLKLELRASSRGASASLPLDAAMLLLLLWFPATRTVNQGNDKN
jgi:hypothetical protein